MSQPCSNCTNLQAEITRLEIEISALHHIIAGASSECIALMNEAKQVLAEHVPPGVWSYNTSKEETAQRILSRLRM